MELIRKYFVLTFVLTDEQYYEKLSIPECPEIVFKIVKESKRKKNYGDRPEVKHKSPPYLMIICQLELFYQHKNKIAAELEKIGKFIVGARFFNDC